MNISRVALVTLMCWGSAYASGYSEEQHESIWQARLKAAQHADVKAEEVCGWRPEEPVTFADDIRHEEGILNTDLFLAIARMVREDQNALAVHNALHGSVGSEGAAEALKQINASNLASMKRYLRDNDFPSLAEIGNSGVNALLLLVAHADADIDFQNDVLEMMRKEVGRGNLPQYIPSILESIRPRVGAQQESSDQPSPSSHPVRSTESPRQCFFSTRSKLIESYLRQNYTAPQ